MNASFRERVSAIDWTRYHHAYGPAEDVPQLLLDVAAADDDAEAFEEATSALWGNVYHQGTRWGVSAKTVPFFAELLVNGPRSLDARLFLVDYLHHLAVGMPKFRFPEAFPVGEFEAVVRELQALGLPQSAIDGDVFEDESELVAAARDRMTAWCELDCFRAVERAVPSLLPLVNDSDAGVAAGVIFLVSSFPAQRASTAKMLWPIARDASQVELRGQALVALGRLGEPVTEAALVLMDADDGVDGLYAACAEILSSASPSEIVRRRLIGLPKTMLAAECAFADSVASLVRFCAQRAPPSAPEDEVELLASLLPAIEGNDRLDAIDRLLTLAFTHPWSGEPLGPLRRQAIAAIVEHATWVLRLQAQEKLLSKRGLPVTREKLRALLS